MIQSRGARRTLTETTGITFFLALGNQIRFSGLEFTSSESGGFRGAIDPRGNGFRCTGCIFNGGDAGILWIGGGIRDLFIADCVFNNCRAGIQFVRDVVRAPGNNNAQRRQRAFAPGRFDILRCFFSGARTEIGILLDSGNDARAVNNPTPNNSSGDPNLPSQGNSLRVDAQNQTTDYAANGRRSVIADCVISDVQLFGIALARSQSINVSDNTITMATRGEPFRNAVQLENRTRAIGLRGNTININNGSSNTVGGIIMVTFTDYGNAARFENGCRNILIDRNRINGNGGTGIGSDGWSDVRVTNNRLQNTLNRRFDFFNRPGGANSFRSTPTGNVVINGRNRTLRTLNPGPTTTN